MRMTCFRCPTTASVPSCPFVADFPAFTRQKYLPPSMGVLPHYLARASSLAVCWTAHSLCFVKFTRRSVNRSHHPQCHQCMPHTEHTHAQFTCTCSCAHNDPFFERMFSVEHSQRCALSSPTPQKALRSGISGTAAFLHLLLASLCFRHSLLGLTCHLGRGASTKQRVREGGTLGATRKQDPERRDAVSKKTGGLPRGGLTTIVLVLWASWLSICLLFFYCNLHLPQISESRWKLCITLTTRACTPLRECVRESNIFY